MKNRYALPLAAVAVAVACGGSAPDARYPAREAHCPVRTYPSAPSVPVDELGIVRAACVSSVDSCERDLLDRVCALGGDVAWGLADNPLGAGTIVAHAAHSRRSVVGAREAGCSVQVFADSPPMPTENVGPVNAVCAEDDSNDTCLRALEDQVCRLGGDVLWEVEGPAMKGDKKQIRGRAAHTR